jgi:hypothetical protein
MPEYPVVWCSGRCYWTCEACDPNPLRALCNLLDGAAVLADEGGDLVGGVSLGRVGKFPTLAAITHPLLCCRPLDRLKHPPDGVEVERPYGQPEVSVSLPHVGRSSRASIASRSRKFGITQIGTHSAIPHPLKAESAIDPATAQPITRSAAYVSGAHLRCRPSAFIDGETIRTTGSVLIARGI